MRICLDLDGVLHDHKNPAPGRRMGPPIDGALESVRALIAQRHDLVICTASAGDGRGGFHYVHDWLRYFGFPPGIEVTCIKPDADVYLDDRGYRFRSWSPETLAEIVRG
jgi:hypothetical protein